MHYEQIKKELKNQKRSRKELADVCMVSKKTVDSWLSEGRPIPALKMRIIEEFLAKGQGDVSVKIPLSIESLQSLSFIMTKEEVAEMRKAAEASGQSLEVWAREALLAKKAEVLQDGSK